jgi:hypothetical protein
MLENILPSIITGVLALIGIIFTNIMSNKQIEHKLELNQTEMRVRLDDMIKQVEKHSEGLQQVPVLVEQMKNLERRIDVIERKVSNG